MSVCVWTSDGKPVLLCSGHTGGHRGVVAGVPDVAATGRSAVAAGERCAQHAREHLVTLPEGCAANHLQGRQAVSVAQRPAVFVSTRWNPRYEITLMRESMLMKDHPDRPH